MKNKLFSITTACAVLGLVAMACVTNVTEARDLKVTAQYPQYYSVTYPSSGQSYAPVQYGTQGNCPNGLCGTSSYPTNYSNSAIGIQNGYRTQLGNCPDGKCGPYLQTQYCPDGKCGLRQQNPYCRDGKCDLRYPHSHDSRSTPGIRSTPDYEIPRLLPPEPSYNGNSNLDARYNNSGLQADEVFNAFHELEGLNPSQNSESFRYNRRYRGNNERIYRDQNISRENRSDYRISPVQYQTPAKPVSNQGRSPYFE